MSVGQSPSNNGAGTGRGGQRAGNSGFLLSLVRVWLPLVIGVGGLIAILIGHGSTNSPWAAAGVSLIIVALIVWMINWLFRMSVQSNRERELEERAREYFEKHGRWPGE